MTRLSTGQDSPRVLVSTVDSQSTTVGLDISGDRLDVRTLCRDQYTCASIILFCVCAESTLWTPTAGRAEGNAKLLAATLVVGDMVTQALYRGRSACSVTPLPSASVFLLCTEAIAVCSPCRRSVLLLCVVMLCFQTCDITQLSTRFTLQPKRRTSAHTHTFAW